MFETSSYIPSIHLQFGGFSLLVEQVSQLVEENKHFSHLGSQS